MAENNEEMNLGEPSKEELETANGGNEVLDALVNADGEKKADEPAAKEQEPENKAGDAEKIEAALKETAEQDPAFRGIIGDLKSERSKRQEAERKLEELNERLAALEAAKTTPQWDETTKPTSIAGLRTKYQLEPGDAFTFAMQEELENNREEKAKLDQQSAKQHEQVKRVGYQRVEAINRQIKISIPKAAVDAGLGFDTVVTEENIENFTGKDWREFYALPKNSAERAQFLYDRAIERTPELREAKSKLPTAQPSPKPKEVKPAAVPKGSTAAESIEQQAEDESAKFHELANMSEDELDAMLKREGALT
jgi:hypothetical protein